MTETGSRPRGRPRQFDEETALDQLTELFWERGFNATSLSDLVEASGVHKPSLYRTFGSKDELFARVLRRYFDRRMTMMIELLDGCGPGRDGVHAFLDLVSDMMTGPEARGCLLVASSVELHGSTPGFDDFAAAYRRRLRELTTRLVARVDDDPDVVESRSALVFAWMMGLDVTVRSGATSEEVHELITAMRTTVDAWT